MKEQLRSEIDKKYQWNLEMMYESREKAEEELNEIEKKLNDYEKFQGHLLDNAKTLYEFLVFDYEIDRKLANL